MPTKTLTVRGLGGIIPECRAGTSRNGGRHQIGMTGAISSESAAKRRSTIQGRFGFGRRPNLDDVVLARGWGQGTRGGRNREYHEILN